MKRVEQWWRWLEPSVPAFGFGVTVGAIVIGVVALKCEPDPTVRVVAREDAPDWFRVEVDYDWLTPRKEFASCSEHMAEELQRVCRRAGWRPAKEDAK